MGMLRAIAPSYWTALAISALAVFVHVRWYTVDKAAGAEVVSGFGAALVVIGTLLNGYGPLIAQALHLRASLRPLWQAVVDARHPAPCYPGIFIVRRESASS